MQPFAHPGSIQQLEETRYSLIAAFLEFKPQDLIAHYLLLFPANFTQEELEEMFHIGHVTLYAGTPTFSDSTVYNTNLGWSGF